MQAIKKSASFFNTVRQAIFYLKPSEFDSRKATRIKTKKSTTWSAFLVLVLEEIALGFDLKTFAKHKTLGFLSFRFNFAFYIRLAKDL